jgi:hypothetical protein
MSACKMTYLDGIAAHSYYLIKDHGSWPMASKYSIIGIIYGIILLIPVSRVMKDSMC